MTPAPSLPPPAALASPPRVTLMGMPIDPLTEAQSIARILDALSAGRGGWVITPNLDHLRQFSSHPDIRALYAQADLVLPDGMPLVWISRLLPTPPFPERVPGSALIVSLTAAAAERHLSIYLLGGAPGAAEAAAACLRRQHPHLRIAGILCPPLGFENDPAQLAAIRASLAQTAPHIVYVGLGFPKQERLIAQLRQDFPRTWFLGIGVSFSFVAGQIRRAPRWMQSLGLEWLHRLAQEPRRLFKRYVLQDLPFALRLLAFALHERTASARPTPQKPTDEVGGAAPYVPPIPPTHSPASTPSPPPTAEPHAEGL